ncbi:dephospho-CoA kinase [Poseidonocella pacifica]|uniref:Dephospho-CoA kinase n=2 Tax=Poseidonocella pacifica TaxID=871651 RepID=A0A1I0XX03_9RHOB|nr:dephospho-CoA kinase [Poseidonocella pacifica]
MGKSTTARMFADLGCAVWDADAAVHRLYGPGGAAVAPIAALYPSAVQDGAVSRAKLREIIHDDPEALRRIEDIVHPLVREDRGRFIDETAADIAVFDIPLLFETKTDQEMDLTVCVSAPEDIQRARVLSRNAMTEQDLDHILARQMSDAEKRARADVIIETKTLEATREQVQALVKRLRENSDA